MPKEILPQGYAKENEDSGSVDCLDEVAPTPSTTPNLVKELPRERDGTLPEPVLGKENKKKLLSPREMGEVHSDETVERASTPKEAETADQGKYKLAKSLLLAELQHELHTAKDTDRELELERAKQLIRDRIDKDKLHRARGKDDSVGGHTRLSSKMTNKEARDFIPREAVRAETEFREKDNVQGRKINDERSAGDAPTLPSKDQAGKISFTSVEKGGAGRKDGRKVKRKSGSPSEKSQPARGEGRRSTQDQNWGDQEASLGLDAKGKSKKVKQTRGWKENSQRCVSMAPMIPSNKRLAEFLHAHNLSNYYGVLLQHDVPYEMLLELNREDFDSLRVPQEDIERFQLAIRGARLM